MEVHIESRTRNPLADDRGRLQDALESDEGVALAHNPHVPRDATQGHLYYAYLQPFQRRYGDCVHPEVPRAGRHHPRHGLGHRHHQRAHHCHSNQLQSGTYGSHQLLPAIAGGGGFAVRSSDSTVISVSSRRGRLGLRGHPLPVDRIPGSNPLDGHRLHIHVDQRRSIPSRTQTPSIRNPSNQNQMPVLDGFHLDIGGDALLSASPQLHRTRLREGGFHLHARLGQHGGLFHHTFHPHPRTQPHHHILHLQLHIQYASEDQERFSLPRQGIRDGLGGEPVESQPHDVVHAGGGLLAVVDPVHRGVAVRVLHRALAEPTGAAFQSGVVGLPELLLEVGDTVEFESAVQAGVAHLLHDDLLQVQRPFAGRADRNGR